MDEAETRSRLEVHHSLTFTRLSSWDQRQQKTQTSSHYCHSFVAPDEKIRSAMHVFNRVIQLQRRSQGIVPQRQRYEKWSISTRVSVLIGMVRSPARRKKKSFVSNVSSTIKRRITVFCDVHDHGVASGGSRARRHWAHRQLKSSWCTAIPTNDRRQRRKAKTTRGRTWLTTNRQVFSGSGAASQCAYACWHDKVKSVQRTDDPADHGRINRHFLTQTSFCRRNDLCPQSVEVSF